MELFDLYFLALAGVLGLVMGSFLACLSYRGTRGESIIKGRSRCPSCGHVLSALDLIPVVSYVFSGGKCRHCKGRISPAYPITELILSLCYISVVWRFGPTPEALEYIILCSLLFVLALWDMDTQIIPDTCIGLIIANFLAFAFIKGGHPLTAIMEGLKSGFAVGLIMLVFVIVMDKLMKKETMGGGDIKLFFALGLYLSFAGCFLLVFVASLVGIVFGLVAMKSRGISQAFPFGPAICISFWVVLLFGEGIISRYMALF